MNKTHRMILPEHGIHVWRFSLISARQEISALGRWLDEREKAALDRMISRVERDRRIVAWGRLRYILSRYLGCLPGDIVIERGSSGRPEIVSPGEVDIHYSLTHSRNHALLAISRMPVGIDLENLRRLADVKALSARFFTQNESEAIASLSVDERIEAFLRVWVRKEAYLKAAGGSVPADLSRCEISAAISNPRVVATEVEEMDSSCQLIDIPVHKGYFAALAVQGDNVNVQIYDL